MSPLVRIQGTLVTLTLRAECVFPCGNPLPSGLPDAIFQQDDNAHPHCSHLPTCSTGVQMLPWQPSPDLSTNPNKCGMSLDAVCKLCPLPRANDQLWQMVERNGEPSSRTPSALLTLYLTCFFVHRRSRWFHPTSRFRLHCVT
ncbi:hypothetical protein TNCV_566871 [Trichonephila clavipes]|nr:hypothetical protein TNCV_566871 [Trichonephila clavipes]